FPPRGEVMPCGPIRGVRSLMRGIAPSVISYSSIRLLNSNQLWPRGNGMDNPQSNDVYAPEGVESPAERDRLDGLIPVVYEELRGRAGLRLSGKGPPLPCQPHH